MFESLQTLPLHFSKTRFAALSCIVFNTIEIQHLLSTLETVEGSLECSIYHDGLWNKQERIYARFSRQISLSSTLVNKFFQTQLRWILTQTWWASGNNWVWNICLKSTNFETSVTAAVYKTFRKLSPCKLFLVARLTFAALFGFDSGVVRGGAAAAFACKVLFRSMCATCENEQYVACTGPPRLY